MMFQNRKEEEIHCGKYLCLNTPSHHPEDMHRLRSQLSDVIMNYNPLPYHQRA
jgi:hypothetical protein